MKKISCICLLCWLSTAGAWILVQIEDNIVPLYEIAVLSASTSNTYTNPFQDVAFIATFTSPSGRTFQSHGFYNGSQTWLMRFMPDEVGTWSYSWQFASTTGNGNFTCIAKQNPKLHGHVRIDPQNRHKLRFDDGTPFHWIGGKYLSFKRPFGFPDKQPLSVPERYSPATYVAYCKNYLNQIAAMGLNGVVLKFSVLPLNYDLCTMDLEYFAYADQIMYHAMNLGIMVQINIFDIWGKRKENVDWVNPEAPPVTDLLLEPWNPSTYAQQTHFYLKYLVSRYAAFPNTMWELWNEAQRRGDSAAAATSAYVPIIRQYDPYKLPIGASELYVATYPELDITFFHGGYKCDHTAWNWMHNATLDPASTGLSKWRPYAAYGFSFGRPILWNELFPYEPETQEQLASWYRACFWGNLTAGSVGTSESPWEYIDQVPNLSTTYHSYFASFINQLIDLNSLMPRDSEVQCSSGTATMCANLQKEYVIYHFTQSNNSQTTLQIYLYPGNYYYRYYNPKNGQWHGDRASRSFSSANFKSFTTPTFNQDIVLYIVEQGFADHGTPVELAGFTAQNDKNGILLRWHTLSETNNYGFEVQRAYSQEEYITLQFIPGNGTTQVRQDYSYKDFPDKEGWYRYRLKQIDLDGSSEYSQAIEVWFSLPPLSPQLQIFPNPTHGGATFSFRLEQENEGELTIYNILGQPVYRKTLSSSNRGVVSVYWDGLDESGKEIAAGVYFCIVKSVSTQVTSKLTKMLVVR